MSKAAKLFKAIRLLVRQPSLLNHVIDTDDNWRRHVDKLHHFAQGLPVVELTTITGASKGEVPIFAFLDGGSLPTDHFLLQQLAAGIEGCRYFEIGTWRGESVANVAPHAAHCTTLNLSDEQMREVGMSEDYIDLIGFFSNHLPNITHLRGDTSHFDFAGLNQKYDLIFIDGDHHYEMVKNDTQKVFANLLHDRSIVVWHDYARNPETPRFDVFAGILDGLPPHLHHNLYHAGNTLSAVYSPLKYKTHTLQNPVRPAHYFSVGLNITPAMPGKSER
ncbi:MAG TPA: class I SAM-dependent methyltransferase [Bacteroidales bacterium]|nr:class I SAM-dependent methyltransferase [Bacteroidales bacterium]